MQDSLNCQRSAKRTQVHDERERKTHHANFWLLINTYGQNEVSLGVTLERWWTPPLLSSLLTSYCMRGDGDEGRTDCTAFVAESNEILVTPNMDKLSHDSQTRERTKPKDGDWLQTNHDNDHDGLLHCTHPRYSPDTSSHLFILLLSSPRYDVRLVIPQFSPTTNRRKSASASARFASHRHTQL
jgi:hypothetical protein